MEELYEQYKSLLFSLAYQLTGSAADAEDAVQDVFIKACDVHPERLEEPKAYLCKMVTNRCLDLLKSARRKRETYVGPWLPEPIPTPEADTLDAVVRSDLLSYAMLVLLERLTPAERAVFVLREALDFDYPDIAEALGKSEANCRKLMSRARGKMGIGEEERVCAEPAGEMWVRRFLAALEKGDVGSVLALLAEDVVLLSDGGGKVKAATRPLETRDRVLRFLLGLMAKAPQYPKRIRIELAALNGQTGLVVREEEAVAFVAFLHVEREAIRRIYIVRNPDKLTRIPEGELA